MDHALEAAGMLVGREVGGGSCSHAFHECVSHERTGRSPLRAVSRPPLIQAIVLYPALCSCSAAARDL